jgi:ribosomal protein S18 acetylase RimI-like enzyme
MSDREQPTGAIQAYTPGKEPVSQLPVPGVRFIRFHTGLSRQLAEVMHTSEATIDQRRALGNRASVALLDDDTIVGYGWVSYDAIRIYELNVEIPIPRGHAYIWDCATVEQYRGRGIFPGLLRFMLEELRLQGIAQVWAGVAPGNTASLKSFARAGFRLVAHTTITDSQFEVWPTSAATSDEVTALRALGNAAR